MGKGGKAAGSKNAPPQEGKKAGAQALSAHFSLVELLSGRQGLLRGPGPLLGLLMILGLYFRVGTTMWDPVIYPDSTQYMSLAQDFRNLSFFKPGYDLEQGFIKSRHLPPVYSALLALVSLLPGELEHQGIWLSIIMSLLTFIPVYYIGKRLLSSGAGLVAVGFLTFHSYVLFYASPLLTEATFSFFFMSTIAAGLWAFEKKTKAAFALAGLVSGLCYMTRDVGITAVVLLAGWAVINFLWLDRQHWRKAALLVGMMALTFFIVCLPYFIHIRVRTGHFGLTVQMSNEKVTEQIFLFGGDRLDRDRLPGREEGTEFIAQPEQTSLTAVFFYLPGLAHKAAVNGYEYGREFIKAFIGYNQKLKPWSELSLSGKVLRGMLRVPLLFMAISWVWGITVALRRRSGKVFFGEAYLFSWMVQLVLLYALVTPYMVDDRYMYPLMMPGLVFSGVGVIRVARWLGETINKRLHATEERGLLRASATAVSAGLITALGFGQMLPAVRDLQQRMSAAGLPSKFAAGHKEVARYLLEHGLVSPGLKVMCRKPFMAYYLKGSYVLMPKTMPEIEEMAKNHEADILVADTFTLEHLRPLLVLLGFGLADPLPGRVIYSRVFPEYKRVITIYDLRVKSQKPLDTAQNDQERIERAKQLVAQGLLYQASRECLEVLNHDPDNVEAHFILAKIHGYYYQVTEALLVIPFAIGTYEKYLQLKPEDEVAHQEYVYFQRILDLVREKIEESRQKQKEAQEREGD